MVYGLYTHKLLHTKKRDDHRFGKEKDEILFHSTSVLPQSLGIAISHSINYNKIVLYNINNSNNSEPYKFKYSLI